MEVREREERPPGQILIPEPGENRETVMTITETEHMSHKSTFEENVRFWCWETAAKGCLLSCWK